MMRFVKQEVLPAASSGGPKAISIFKGLLLVGILGGPMAYADNHEADSSPSESQPDVLEKRTSTPLPTITVFGSAEGDWAVPGSGYYVTSQEIKEHSYDDINRVLRKVPGVYLREEDGYGLFPNLSVRGADTTRSSKLTLMEDGVLAAPAPYSAPSAYYSPNAGRMDAIEILKGSSQIQYGPHITGGVVNYVSTPIPSDARGYLKAIFGEDGEVRTHVSYGDMLDLGESGRFGYLVENYYRDTDGFKTIDSTQGFNGGETGFRNIEPMLKLMWEPSSDHFQQFEFKVGYTDRDANETYLGLSESDFSDNLYRRYAASRFDHIDTYQTRLYLRHFIEITDEVQLATTGYYNRFHRNWYKLNDIRNIDTDGDGVGDGVNSGNASALAGSNAGAGLDVLRGNRVGDLRVRANNRDYYSYGIQLDPTININTESVNHEVRLGVRYHVDRVRRFQRNDIYEQAANGSIADNDGDGIAFNRGIDGDAGDRRQETRALATYLQDAISFDKWTVTPGIRFEHLWQEHVDNDRPARSGINEMNMVGGGIGVEYGLNDQVILFAGAHRGFSAPSPRAAQWRGLDEETSIALEAGARYANETGLAVDLTPFFTHFDDLIVVDNVGGAGTGNTENVGEVDSVGVEVMVQLDPENPFGWGVRTPTYLSFTYTAAELASDSNSQDPESIFAGGRKGNKVPYIPEYTLSVGTGLDFGTFGVFVAGSYVDEIFTSASNTSNQIDGAGNPDARFGTLDSHFVVDLSSYYQLNKNAKLLAGIHNIFDEDYMASRHPHGPRPGKSHFVYVGIEIDF